MKSKRIAIIAGTRPEIIKLAPVYHQLQKFGIAAEMWLMGQQPDLIWGLLDFFEITPTYKWNVFKAGQNPNLIVAKVMRNLDKAFSKVTLDAVLVQGDTSTALAGAMAAFHQGIPVGHVEAGLRTHNLSSPFPEEMNRKVIDSISKWHFPPTEQAVRELSLEGIKEVSPITGNTGIDAFRYCVGKVKKRNFWPREVRRPDHNTKLVLSTMHRRENLGESQVKVLNTLREEISRDPKYQLIHVQHPNSRFAADWIRRQQRDSRLQYIKALTYVDFVALMSRADVIVTDSGGIQEEAVSYGIPVMITREETERPEVLSCGGVLVGKGNGERLASELKGVLCAERTEKTFVKTPFGDGTASKIIASFIKSQFKVKKRKRS